MSPCARHVIPVGVLLQKHRSRRRRRGDAVTRKRRLHWNKLGQRNENLQRTTDAEKLETLAMLPGRSLPVRELHVHEKSLRKGRKATGTVSCGAHVKFAERSRMRNHSIGIL